MPFIDLASMATRELIPGFHVRFVHSETMTLAYWNIEADAEMPVHSHPHEQIVNVITGEFDLVLGDETRRMGAGAVAIVPSHTPHGGRAATACRIIDAFHPVREDYR